MLLLNGKEAAKRIEENIANRVSTSSYAKSLVILQVGSVPASDVYVGIKIKFGARVGINVHVQKFAEDVTTDVILPAIHFCNQDETVGGIILQLPIPDHLDKTLLLNAIDPQKDIDGLGFLNAGKLLKKDLSGKIPATPKGIISLLDAYGIELKGKNIVVAGRSQLVGLPLAILLTYRDATVTVVHSHTKNIEAVCKSADIIIAAVGKAHMFNKNFIKEGAVVVDVGINRLGEKLVGDVDFDDVKDIVAGISPVPGGVGPMTVVSLFENMLD